GIAVGRRVAGDDAPADAGSAGAFDAVALVVGKGAAADAHRAAFVDEAAAVAEGGAPVAGERAGADAQRPVVDEAAAEVGVVAGEGAAADAHRATFIVEAAAYPVVDSISDGEGLEGEADAAVHEQHPHAVAAIEGDLLAAAIQGQVHRDS